MVFVVNYSPTMIEIHVQYNLSIRLLLCVGCVKDVRCFLMVGCIIGKLDVLLCYRESFGAWGEGE